MPANANNPAVTWESSNPAVATVSAAGLVTGVSAGNATVTVTTVDGGFTATSAITVTVPVPGGTETNVLAVLTPNTRKPAASTPVYDEPINNDNPGALYHTGAHDYRSGLFIFQLPPLEGAITEVTFNAYYKSVGTGFSVSLFGHNPIADIVTLPPATTYWGYGPAAGQPGTELKASFVGDGAAVNAIGWVSTDVTDFIRDHYVAGQYIVLRVGSTFDAPTDADSEALHPTTRAMFDGGTSAATNNRVPYLSITTSGASVPVTGVSVNPTAASLLVGGTQQMIATVAPANAVNAAVTWASSDPAVAMVNASGLVTAVSAGNATITVTTEEGGFTASSTITVSSPIIAVTGVSVAPDAATVSIGATQQLVSTVAPANATNPAVTWSSSDPAVATVNGSGLVTAAAPGNATITVTTQSGGFTAAAEITVPALSATVTLGNTNQIYNGSPRPVSVTTQPAGLAVAVTYDGSSVAPTNVGTYAVTATVTEPNYTGSTVGTLTISDPDATITLGNLRQSYDGTPRAVTSTTNPEGLAVTITYDGSATPPIYPGTYAVAASIDDANYTAEASGELIVTTTALVRHAPVINGGIDGSVQQLLPESTTLNGTAWISGDLLVPGTPNVRLNGRPFYAGTLDGPGAVVPSNHQITLNGSALLRYTVRRIDAIAMPVVAAPPSPAGSTHVTLNKSSDHVSNWATVRDLTLNGNAGKRTIPAGTYGTLAANGNSGFVLGVAGATEPAIYNLQGLTLNGNSRLEVVGPVIITLSNGVIANGAMGNQQHPDWLVLRFATGGLTLNGNAIVYGTVIAPSGQVAINGNSSLVGEVVSDRLTINGNSQLTQPDLPDEP